MRVSLGVVAEPAGHQHEHGVVREAELRRRSARHAARREVGARTPSGDDRQLRPSDRRRGAEAGARYSA
jgi:hypothetical protein